MDSNNPGSGDLICQTLTTGVVVAYVPQPPASIGQTLGVGTYVFSIGSQNAPAPAQTALVSFHVRWAAAVAATMTVEVCNFPAFVGGIYNNNADIDVADYDNGNNWQQWNPPTAGTYSAVVTGTGNTATAFTVVAGGTNAGTAYFNLPDTGARRIRLKIITTVGGLVRVNARGKFGE